MGTVVVTPYYSHAGITILLGDCRDILPTRVPDSFDIVVTSPPYNMGLVPGGNGRGMYRPGANGKAGRFREGYDGTSDALDQQEYNDHHRVCLAHLWRLVRLGIFYNHRPRVEHGRLRVPLDFDFDPAILRQIIIWDRGTGIDVNLRNYCTRQEWILLFAKPAFSLVDHAASGTGDVWRLGMEYQETGHPAPFPVSLPLRCLQTTGAQSVLDPFLGSGSTLLAAKALGITGVGIEISEAYAEIAANRLRQEVLPLTPVPARERQIPMEVME